MVVEMENITYSDDSYVVDGWHKFPVTRPTEGSTVLVLMSPVELFAKAIMTDTGIAIKIRERTFDSNWILWWKYA